MNRIVVAKHFDGSQSLHNLKEVLNIGKLAAQHYKQQWRREKAQLQALCNWCGWKGIHTLEVRYMDGRLDNWLIKAQ